MGAHMGLTRLHLLQLHMRPGHADLIVDLQIGSPHKKFALGSIPVIFYVHEDIFNGTRNDAPAGTRVGPLHGERLTCAGLTICNDSCIIPLQSCVAILVLRSVLTRRVSYAGCPLSPEAEQAWHYKCLAYELARHTVASCYVQRQQHELVEGGITSSEGSSELKRLDGIGAAAQGLWLLRCIHIQSEHMQHDTLHLGVTSVQIRHDGFRNLL